MTAQEGFYSLPFYCCSPFGQSMALLPNLHQVPLCSWVPLWVNCHRASAWPGASQVELLSLCSQDQVRATLLTASHRLPCAESLSPWRSLLMGWKKVSSIFSTLPLVSVPYIALPANLPLSGGLAPSLPGFPTFFHRKWFFQSLHKSPGGKELAFQSQLAPMWYGRQWE